MRKPIGNSKRFEIFKRDKFTCQYCGNHPPKTILELDHIIPVSKGGGNEEDNLATSCFECNRGKAARSLNTAPKSLKDKAEQIKEADEQLIGYQNIIREQMQRVEDETFEVLDELGLTNEDGSARKKDFRDVKLFINKIGFLEVLEAAEIATSASTNNVYRYFCGVCWNKYRSLEV